MTICFNCRASELAKASIEMFAEDTLADAERAHITAVPRQTNWVIGGPYGAAAQLGLPRTTLIARMQRLGISNSTLRSQPVQSTRPLMRVMRKPSSHLKDGSSDDLRVMEAVAG